MSFLRPQKMVKIGLIGLKDDREALLTTLHDLNVAQIETISKGALEHLDPERGSDLQRTVADLLIRYRGLKTALPSVPDGSRRSFADLEELLAVAKTVPIDDEVGSLKREEDRLLTDRKALTDEIDLLTKHPYYIDRLEYLHGGHIVSFFGEGKAEAFEEFRAELPGDTHLLIGSVGDRVTFLAAVPTAEADTVGRSAQTRQITLTTAPRLTGTRDEALPLLTGQRGQIEKRLAEIRSRLTELSRQWYPTVLLLEEALAIENRKLEVYTKFGAGRRTFALEGWVPVRDRARLESEVTRVTQGRIHLYEIPTTEEPPTLMDNPPGIRWFEFFIKFYSLPQATEWDPTWIFAIVFPIFFGFMLGDWGYGLVILLISVWMTQGFPGARYLPKWLKGIPRMIMGTWAMRSLAYALIPGCIAAIVAGIVFNSFFGAHILPIPYTDPVSPSGAAALLLIAGFIGLGMVSFGFFLGALKEYFHHHIRGAIGKLGGIAFAWGVAIIGLRTIRHQVPGIPAGGIAAWAAATPLDATLVALLVVGFAALVIGEGGMALLGLIEIVSHILSYTRLVGILLASVVLTVVAFHVEGLLAPLWFPGGLIAGIVVVVVIELFNIILGVFEPGIQGARLIFVENFSKYFSGNGKAFHAFGSRRQHTLPHRSEIPPTPPVPAA
ncbi:MAG TPA: V-type ATP synthase subunit I [Thermoplasmata archaeon]|nr:V-type ATP synthase subunit I [Thermoplasmata archaeon]